MHEYSAVVPHEVVYWDKEVCAYHVEKISQQKSLHNKKTRLSAHNKTYQSIIFTLFPLNNVRLHVTQQNTSLSEKANSSSFRFTSANSRKLHNFVQ